MGVGETKNSPKHLLFFSISVRRTKKKYEKGISREIEDQIVHNRKLEMEAKIHQKSVTSCAAVLLNIFQKHRHKNKPCNCCTCMCHTYESKDKNSSEMVEINDNKFFNCKCNHECHKLSNCKKCEKLKQSKRRRPRKKIVKFQIQHTASMNSLTSPYKQVCSCDKLRNTLSLCKMVHGKPCADSLCSPVQRSLTEKNDYPGRFFNSACLESRYKLETLSQPR